jgi:hypothetical protein
VRTDTGTNFFRGNRQSCPLLHSSFSLLHSPPPIPHSAPPFCIQHSAFCIPFLAPSSSSAILAAVASTPFPACKTSASSWIRSCTSRNNGALCPDPLTTRTARKRNHSATSYREAIEHRRKDAVAICDRIQAQYPPPAFGLHRTRRAHGRQYPQQPPRRRHERLCQANSVCRGRDTGCPVPPSQIPAGGIAAPGSSRWHVVFAHRKVCPFNPSFLRHGLPVCASPTRRPLLQLRGLRLAAGYYEPIRLPERQTALLVVAPPFLLGPRS